MLKVSIERTGLGVYIVRPVGRIVGKEDDDRVNKALSKCERNKKCRHIVLDLSDVDFMDSAFVGAIGYHHAIMSQEKGDLFVVNQNFNPFNYVHRIIEFFSVDKVVRVFSNLGDCMEVIRKKTLMAEAEKICREKENEEIEERIQKKL
jgi:anti-anti-sigma factor